MEDALRFLKRYGLSWIELRELWAGRPLYQGANKKELRRVKDLLEKYHIKASVIATHLYISATYPAASWGFTPQRNYYKYSQQSLLWIVPKCPQYPISTVIVRAKGCAVLANHPGLTVW